MKFSDYPNIITDKYGFQFVKNNIMISKKECGCLVCGAPSRYIEVCSEAHFCSDECVAEFDRQYNRMLEFDAEMSKIASTYKISEDHAGCYINNYEGLMCNQHGGCEHFDKCKEIFKKEKDERREV